MSLKLRNIIAIILLLAAAICWTFGRQILGYNSQDGTAATTAPVEYWNTTEATYYSNTIPATEYYDEYTTPSTMHPTTTTNPSVAYQPNEEINSRSGRLLGFILSFAAIAFVIIAVFVLKQKNSIFGPDGICLLGGIAFLVYNALQNLDYLMWSYIYDRFLLTTAIIKTFLILLVAREVWGWICSRFSLKWCLAHRFSERCKRPQYALAFSAVWITVSGSVIAYLLLTHNLRNVALPVCCFAGAVVFGFLHLWRYGADLHHFKIQLNNYQQGLPITVSNGAFAQTEAQLLQVQAQHEEAVRTAVTSERFKVELISNVSHDLRTPLTSILGYSELLQKEALSAEGQEQLQRLQQKAGYMSDLVESLFELTKVSSGVIESKKEEIDLIRLLEQTIGLFDDQLTHAGLFVRRNYASDSVMVVTDGARMHQVFANLLGNAIKYAMTGTRIYMEVKETENSFFVRMMNTASYEMDFKPEEIMQRFARGDKARSTKGSGLGLAIAQTYTESVGGSFRVGVDGDQFSAIVELPKIERNL